MEKTPIFSKEEVNTGRQFEFDISKFLCLLGMVFCHCYEQMGVSRDNTFLYFLIAIVFNGMFGATLFMQCMGFGIAYSKNSSPLKLIKRGLILFVLAHVLNFFRFVLPLLFCEVFSSASFTPAYYFMHLGCPDIMQFAGLALALFGLLKLLKLKDWMIFVLSLAMSIAGLFINVKIDGYTFLTGFLGNFIRTTELQEEYLFSSSAFPLLSWFIIVVIGYLYGKLIRRINNISKYYAIVTPVTGVLVMIALIIMVPNHIGLLGLDIYESFYPMATYYVPIVFVSFVFDTGVCYYLSLLIKGKVKDFIIKSSVNINTIYCIQWVVIGWLDFCGRAFFNIDGYREIVLVVVAFIIFIISVALAYLYKNVFLYNQKKKANAAQTESNS